MIALLIALLVAGLGAIVFVARRPNVSPVLSISLFFTLTLWYVIPVVTTLTAPERLADRLIVPVDDFVRYAVIETAAFVAMIAIFALAGRSIRVIENGRLARLILPRGLLTAIVVGGALVHVGVRWKLLSLMGGSYADVNAFASTAGASAGVAGILSFLDGILIAIAAACAVTPMRGMRFARFVIWTWLLWLTYDGIRIGARLNLLTPCILLLMALHERRPSRVVIAATYGAVIAFIATAGVLLTLIIAEVRNRADVTVSEVGRQSKVILAEEPSSIKDRLWEFFDHLNIKFDSISAGAYLVERFGSAQAMWKPYEGAVLSLVPRSVVPSKPVPGSMDGTEMGTPSRFVAAALGYDISGNVGVSPAATSIWQLGSLGLFVLVGLNALNLCFINALLLRPGIVTRAMAMFLISIPSFYGIFTSAEFHLMNAERILAIYAMGTAALYLFHPTRAQARRPAEGARTSA